MQVSETEIPLNYLIPHLKSADLNRVKVIDVPMESEMDAYGNACSEQGRLIEFKAHWMSWHVSDKLDDQVVVSSLGHKIVAYHRFKTVKNWWRLI